MMMMTPLVFVSDYHLSSCSSFDPYWDKTMGLFFLTLFVLPSHLSASFIRVQLDVAVTSYMLY
jgi:hypothetical protein